MSLLIETITSYLPFNGEPWFFSNYETQLHVLQLCWEGLHHLIVQSPDEETFTQHVSHLVKTRVEIEANNFLEDLVSEIDGGDYLLGRGWFCNSLRRQVNVFLIKMHGYSHDINVVAPDFDEHVESIMLQILQDRQTARDEALASMREADNVANNPILPHLPLHHRDVTDELQEIALEALEAVEELDTYPFNRLIRSHGVTEDTRNYGLAYQVAADGTIEPVYRELSDDE